MPRSRYTQHSRRSGQPSQNIMGEMFRQTPGWVWIVVIIVLILLWKFTG